MEKVTLDEIDKKILMRLQKDAMLSLQAIADSVHLTSTPCWKRIKRLESLGVIRNRVAILDAELVGRPFIAFVQLKTQNHSERWYRKFMEAIDHFDAVMACYRMAGEYDYLLRVQVADMAAFDRFYKRLVNEIDGLTDVTSSFAMEVLKESTALEL
ncbi:DNA-binding transcriptional activator DecR [Vibrio stylophorae]|uniref:DNA-binding transcriptional activator DecR n=1 Tax=Vibrio stylophorae TaxID=659351 RepID=A0ABN8DV70_9VIBR|nr:Lrp/AsnC family transcriptional regulator [Vibrio stylophorae]CAH0533947.1 DNA-binding transcriptional activator DecR [Vibrio stylophorae]